MLKDKLEKLISQNYIRKTKHPIYDLYIYNYTIKTQIERYWNKYTKMARGLVLNSDGDIIARPFQKFFNLGELSESEIPKDKSFVVYEKLDGSLGIICKYKNEIIISTRGSFVSDQAIRAKKIFSEKYSNVTLEDDKTYLVEIIYPENQIVVNYNGIEDLFLLGIIDNKTGRDLPLDHSLGFPVVQTYDGISDYTELRNIHEDNKEGFVVKFENDFRMKIKMDEYVRLHRIVTGITNRTIWDSLRNGDDILTVLSSVPDEFYDWAKKVQNDLVTKYSEIESTSWQNLSELQRLISHKHNLRETRRAQAEFIHTKPYPNVLFAMLDGKDYSKIIWKMIKPTVIEIPFQSLDNK